MADLRNNFAGIRSPNPFWLASGPPTDKAYNVERAFEAGWGGVIWKTVGEPVVNVSSRYGANAYNGTRVAGFTNIELISDRSVEINLREIKEVKKRWPDRAVVVSLMVPCEEPIWESILHQVNETGCDGVELNFGCPHGMSERGMGAAVGQVPEYVAMVTRWAKQHSRVPVIVKLTPNVNDVLFPAQAAVDGNADAVSLINTVASVIGVDLDTMSPLPEVNGKGSHGGYCGPAVKPIALRMIGDIAREFGPDLRISGIGGISTWHDAAEHIAMGAANVQVCTAAMHQGFKIVEDMIDGLSNWMDSKGYRTLDDFRGHAIPNYVRWENLDMNYEIVARIDQDACIKCGLCHIACEDTAHQAITARTNGTRRYEVIDKECVGCNLCMLVCPVENCITMERVDNGKPYTQWSEDPRNPANRVAAE
ncbi:MAG: NAD-dependent dihydropyrimidine dehydrogenase subunit PreA [Proteobacteria bacterium]|nr:NAD-dependent dihydropyrimidine dehydrogenase subunit PreA [Pseudomonadota bacterium]MDA1058832.1 NAD-dependent dihydropyrimidine dehydrogenase subunit PreA [Pseudomonadota bacterium]